jgi:hypothetical protein
MRDKATLLYEWRQLRLELQKEFSQKQLQNIMDWFSNLKPAVHGFNYDDMHTWPDIWEYINEGWYTHSGNGLASYYTIDFAYPEKDVQLWLVHDMLHGDMYLVTYVDGYILKRSDGKVCNYEENKKDLHIMEKFDKMKIISTLKERK